MVDVYERECAPCAHVCMSARIHMNVCVCSRVIGFCCFFFHTGSTVVHMCAFETVWGLVVSCTPPTP